MSRERGRLEEAEAKLADRRARVGEALRTGDVSPLRSSRDLAEYAWELARSGRWDDAEVAALLIEDDPEERGQTLAILAQELVRRDSPQQAAALAVQIPDDRRAPEALQEKVLALVAIAKTFAKNGDRAETDRIVGIAFATLDALAGEGSPWLEPQVLLDVGRILDSWSERQRALELWWRAVACAEGIVGDIDCLKLLGELGAQFARAGEASAVEELLKRLPPGHTRQTVRDEIDKRL